MFLTRCCQNLEVRISKTLFFTKECQLINEDKMIELENDHYLHIYH